MHCPACGKQLPEDPYFCAYCGALIQAAPAPLPKVVLDLRTGGSALLGIVAAVPASAGFWLLAGGLAAVPWAQRLTLGALIAVLCGLMGAALQGQILWPLEAKPPRCSARQLGLVYGLGGGLTAAIGAAIVGAVVLHVAWHLGLPTIPSLLTGAASGVVGAAFALPPALLVGATVGYGLGQVASGWPRPAAVWAAALAWWLAGSVGGGVTGAFVATQTDLVPSTGVYLGAILQSLLALPLLPIAAYLVRWTLVLLS